MRKIFTIALLMIQFSLNAQDIMPGDVVYFINYDTMTFHRHAIASWVMETYDNSTDADLLFWFGTNEGYTDIAVHRITSANDIHNNVRGYITKAELLEWDIPVHGYIPLNHPPSTVDFTQKLINGKYQAQDISRKETYSGTTNGSGLYTVTFATAYPVTPNIQATIIGGTTDHALRVVSVSTTGFQVHVYELSDQDNVSGASVQVLITQN